MQATSAGLDAEKSKACASLHAVMIALEAMLHWLDAFECASTLGMPDSSLLDILQISTPSSTSRQANAFSGPSAESPDFPAGLSRGQGSSELRGGSLSFRGVPPGHTDNVGVTPQGNQACYHHLYSIGTAFALKHALHPFQSSIYFAVLAEMLSSCAV